jgi:hypothetical protein
MKAVVTDVAALVALRPLDVVAYLRAHGWTPFESEPGAAVSEWSKDGPSGYAEVQVPLHPAWRDYARRVQEVLSVLADEERRSQLDVMREVANVARDVVRFRSVVDGRADGTMPLEDAARVTAASRNLMLAAACAAVEPRRAYHTRRPPQATGFLDELSMGQTEHGSFVMTLFSHVPPSLHLQSAFPFGDPASPEPFNRQVTRRLGTALSAVAEAAITGVTTGDMASFEARVDDGVSADLCEALALVNDCKTVTQLDISIGWAAARPPLDPPRNRHEFTRDSIDVIREAGRMLRERAPVEDLEIEGIVVDVTRPAPDLVGRATVLAPVQGSPRKVRIDVAGDDWNTANDAMVRHILLRCRGDLVREGKLYVLRAARDLRLAPTDD